ncbi:ATPase, histidine kinase-, DNA gyrase B-, and HSP90-like domain protein [Synechococcus sp. PCC 7335]|uniref:ATP-binding protein n=1 Tax=Synechococcus sp. (strain ATCC 29403 / PCC 7335) TaxID=91464 RepID=UPI00017EB474|nr:ATP-binding protein [Synechococcus sp. PCC 7335]EDX83882.1 ATPase, histidine kinase-, DNA gyrase B-, and HSP90-like domain protein [Synechococcus sp. PCC 7335]
MRASESQFPTRPHSLLSEAQIDKHQVDDCGTAIDKRAMYSEAGQPNPKVYSILIVDDSETDRLTYQRYIQSTSVTTCKTLEADCGEVGLALSQQYVPDLILLDYMLPDLDGLEFIEALNNSATSLPPVIMLTGEGNEKIAVEAMKVGVRDYLVKRELTPQSLSQAIQRVLSQQALEQLVSRQQRQQRLMSATALRISQSVDLEGVLQTTVDGIRELLDCDRAAVYKFKTRLEGTIIAESILPGWTSGLGTKINDTCFQTGDGLLKYLDGYKTVISDIHLSKLTPCHVRMLERFQVKANLVVPIVLIDTDTQEKKVWGLLLAHHCRAAREWLEDELVLLDALAVQIAIAIQKSEFVSAIEARAAELAITNHKLMSTMQQLKERNQELDDFAYIASHDLRAPLRAIASLASWLEEDISDKIPDESKEQIQLIQQRTQRLDSFIVGLLDYSRAGCQTLKREPVDTRALVLEVIESLSPPEKFSIVLPENMPVLNTYKLLMHQVFSNLIGNAIKYHDREDGTIKIDAQDLGGKFSFSVTDDGPGIDPAYHQKIFGLFQTLNNRDTVDSTGIGLSIVKKIVEKQKGSLSVNSATGKGSTFSFTWAQ